MSGAGAAEKVAAKEAEHVIAKAVERAGVRDAEKVAAKDAEKDAVKTAAKKVRDPYSRPKGFRKGVRDKVWDGAKSADGKVRDPLTGKVMDRTKPCDMGHKPGYEFRKHRESSRQRDIPRKDFLDEHNDPTHYRPELPSSNSNHAAEDHTSRYLGP
jgi:predicted ribonuclease toxin of YeeF-YezG toxin-antitoxin module